MFRAYHRVLSILFVTMDVGLILASFLLSWYVKFVSGYLYHTSHMPFQTYVLAVLFAVIAFISINAMSGLYKPMRAKSMWSELFSVVRSSVIAMLIFISGLFVFKLDHFSRDVLVLFFVFQTVLTVVERVFVRTALRWLRRKGFNRRFILMVGWSQAAERFLERLNQNPWVGYQIVGYVGDEQIHNIRRLGTLMDLPGLLNSTLVDNIVISLPRSDSQEIGEVIKACENVGVQSLILPDYFDVLPAKPRFETFGEIPLIDTRYVPLDDATNALLKRGFDIMFSTLVLVLLSPLFALIALLVRISSRGPIFYAQERVGKNRKPFKMYKFRTMYMIDSNLQDDNGWTQPDDPRRTGIGGFLRKSSLDELPQFWNVLKGDMSVIGPRPERPVFVEMFREEVPRYMVKHRVRPGITGWAQVNGWRGDTSIAERIRFDIDYIENWSFWMDLKIVVKTLSDGFVNRNAY